MMGYRRARQSCFVDRRRLSFEELEARCMLTTWTGGLTGTGTNWFVPGNWANPAAVPGASDTASFRLDEGSVAVELGSVIHDDVSIAALDVLGQGAVHQGNPGTEWMLAIDLKGAGGKGDMLLYTIGWMTRRWCAWATAATFWMWGNRRGRWTWSSCSTRPAGRRSWSISRRKPWPGSWLCEAEWQV